MRCATLEKKGVLRWLGYSGRLRNHLKFIGGGLWLFLGSSVVVPVMGI